MSREVATMGTGPFDRVLVELFAANKSPDEVVQDPRINGVITPAQALARISKILDSKDALDQVRKKKLILESAYSLSAKLRAQIDKMEFIGKDDAAIYLKTLKELMAMVDSANVDIDAAVGEMRKAQAIELVAAVRSLVEMIGQQLHEKYDIIDAIVVEEVAEKALPSAVKKISFADE